MITFVASSHSIPYWMHSPTAYMRHICPFRLTKQWEYTPPPPPPPPPPAMMTCMCVCVHAPAPSHAHPACTSTVPHCRPHTTRGPGRRTFRTHTQCLTHTLSLCGGLSADAAVFGRRHHQGDCVRWRSTYWRRCVSRVSVAPLPQTTSHHRHRGPGPLPASAAALPQVRRRCSHLPGQAAETVPTHVHDRTGCEAPSSTRHLSPCCWTLCFLFAFIFMNALR